MLKGGWKAALISAVTVSDMAKTSIVKGNALGITYFYGRKDEKMIVSQMKIKKIYTQFFT